MAYLFSIDSAFTPVKKKATTTTCTPCTPCQMAGEVKKVSKVLWPPVSPHIHIYINVLKTETSSKIRYNKFVGGALTIQYPSGFMHASVCASFPMSHAGFAVWLWQRRCRAWQR